MFNFWTFSGHLKLVAVFADLWLVSWAALAFNFSFFNLPLALFDLWWGALFNVWDDGAFVFNFPADVLDTWVGGLPGGVDLVSEWSELILASAWCAWEVVFTDVALVSFRIPGTSVFSTAVIAVPSVVMTVLAISVFTLAWAWGGVDRASVFSLVVDAFMHSALVFAFPRSVNLMFKFSFWVFAVAFALFVIWDSFTDLFVVFFSHFTSVFSAVVDFRSPSFTVWLVSGTVFLFTETVWWRAVLIFLLNVALVSGFVEFTSVLSAVVLSVFPSGVDLPLAKLVFTSARFAVFSGDLTLFFLKSTFVLSAVVVSVSPRIADSVETKLVLTFAGARGPVWPDVAHVAHLKTFVGGAVIISVVPFSVDLVFTEFIFTCAWFAEVFSRDLALLLNEFTFELLAPVSAVPWGGVNSVLAKFVRADAWGIANVFFLNFTVFALKIASVFHAVVSAVPWIRG